MLSLFFLVIGLIIILFSLLFIKSYKKEDDLYEESNENNRDLALSLESIENIIDDISITFNNTIEEIEKKYKVLESKIEKVETKSFENQSNQLNENFIKNIYDENNENYIDIDEKIKTSQKDNEDFIGKEEYDIKIEKVKKLRNTGMGVPEIAKALNMGIGEVLLIINLDR